MFNMKGVAHNEEPRESSPASLFVKPATFLFWFTLIALINPVSRADGDQNKPKRRVNTGLAFLKWSETETVC